MQDLRIKTELVDASVVRRLEGNQLSLFEEEKKREEYLDRVFTGKDLECFNFER